VTHGRVKVKGESDLFSDIGQPCKHPVTGMFPIARRAEAPVNDHSTVTLLARLRSWSTSVPSRLGANLYGEIPGAYGEGEEQVLQGGLVEFFRERPGKARSFCPVHTVLDSTPGNTAALRRLPR
jgi:hypothetical protein